MMDIVRELRLETVTEKGVIFRQVVLIIVIYVIKIQGETATAFYTVLTGRVKVYIDIISEVEYFSNMVNFPLKA